MSGKSHARAKLVTCNVVRNGIMHANAIDNPALISEVKSKTYEYMNDVIDVMSLSNILYSRGW